MSSLYKRKGNTAKSDRYKGKSFNPRSPYNWKVFSGDVLLGDFESGHQAAKELGIDQSLLNKLAKNNFKLSKRSKYKELTVIRELKEKK